jgi:hypothetical protein
MRYGDQLLSEERWCDAVPQYENAQAIAALDSTAQEGYERAFRECFPPTPTIDLTAIFTPIVTAETPVATTEPAPTDAPTDVPTDVPTDEPTEVPAD